MILIPLYYAHARTIEKEEEVPQEEIVDVAKYLTLLDALEKEVKRLEWETFSVQEKIYRLTSEEGVDTSLALNIACAESMFHADAQNPTSSAGGVYQWLDSSWALYSNIYYGYIEEKMNEDRNIEMSIWVLRDHGPRDWEASRVTGVGGGWQNKPYERGLCPIS